MQNIRVVFAGPSSDTRAAPLAWAMLEGRLDVRRCGDDAAATEDAIPIVEHRNLAAGHRSYGRRKVQRRSEGATRSNVSDGALVTVTDPHASIEGQRDSCCEHDVVERCGSRMKLFAITEANGARIGIDGGYECPVSDRDTKSLALPDGEPMHAFMSSHHSTLRVDNGPRPNATFGTFLDEGRVRSRSRTHKTELLALALRGPRNFARDSLGADFRLPAFAERKGEPRKKRLRSGVEEITLVLRLVRPLAKKRDPIARASEAGVVTRCDTRRPKTICQREELGDFHPAVARCAWTGRFTRKVSLDEWRYDRLGKEFAPIERKMWDPQGICGSSRIVLVFWSAAASVGTRPLLFGVVPKVKGDADDVVAFVHQARGGDGRIDTARHCDENALTLAHGRFFACEPSQPIAFGYCMAANASAVRGQTRLVLEASGAPNETASQVTPRPLSVRAIPSMARAWSRLAHDLERPSSRAASSKFTSSK